MVRCPGEASAWGRMALTLKTRGERQTSPRSPRHAPVPPRDKDEVVRVHKAFKVSLLAPMPDLRDQRSSQAIK